MTAAALSAATYRIHPNVKQEGWTRLFASVGMERAEAREVSEILVVPGDFHGDIEREAASKLVVVEGYGAAAAALGIETRPEKIAVRHLIDTHAPDLPILWAQPVTLPGNTLSPLLRSVAKERWSGMSVMASRKTAHGGVLWIAANPGDTGYDRFPYVLQALRDLGLDLPAQSVNLAAFFDSAYRIRADPDFLAARWRASGIARLYIAGWHNMEPDALQDAFLKSVIEACHRHAIVVYAWLELPHVSEKFWDQHPAWREKTAAGQDAQLDWRKLMNLQSAECRKAIQASVRHLLDRFDWDGVNLSELYFESLEGASNPARFTPMNSDVRASFQRANGFDPHDLFDAAGPRSMARNPAGLRQFLDYRSQLASRMQGEWLEFLESEHRQQGRMDVVLTHIDDRFQPDIRDALGADVARTVPALEARRETLLVEDPAPLWNLGPERYRKLAESYRALVKNPATLAVDLNIVERYQDVYPTKKQTGVELLELIHQAAISFGKVALYIENSLEPQDLPLLAVAASTARVTKTAVDRWQVQSNEAVRLAWSGPAEVDGKPWPLADERSLLLPPGRHTIMAGLKPVASRLLDFNGDPKSVLCRGNQILLSYDSKTRAIARFDRSPATVDVDGSAIAPAAIVLLPAGQHVMTVELAHPGT